MYKNKILPVFFLIMVLNGCYKNTNRVHFSINPEDRKIILPVHLNNRITANMVFDSRAFFTLDSSFCVSNNLNVNNPDTIKQMGSAWTYRSIQGFVYDKSQDVKIGNTNLTYPNMQIYDWKGYSNSNESDGILGIPPQDTTHVWELNFENNYLEIHSAAGFKMPKNCFVVPVEGNQGYSFEVQLPIRIMCSNGDTLVMNQIFFIDTGMYLDIVVMHPTDEWEFFNKRENAIWSQTMGSYNRRYTVNATLFDGFVMDSLRVYSFDDPRQVGCKYLIGQNFLKRFNMFFDLKNRQMGFQPIKNFQRVVNPLTRRFHYSTVKTQDGKTIVSKIADYQSNYFRMVGLKEGDEIVAVNGLPYNNYSYDYLQYNSNTFLIALRNKNIIYEDGHFFKEDTLVFDIIRDKKLIKIVVPVDKTEKQGD